MVAVQELADHSDVKMRMIYADKNERLRILCGPIHLLLVSRGSTA
jgi:hypothetical protein